MATRERTADRGTRLAKSTLARAGAELREARLDRGLNLDAVASVVRISPAQVSRVERALAPMVALATLSRLSAAVGLELALRFYPAGPPVRDAAHAQLLADLRKQLHPTLRWALEVPLPAPGDQRGWDALIAAADWRFGVEAETGPRDAQALLRRLHLKERDGGVDGVILALRDNRATREFLEGAGSALRESFPVRTRTVLEALRNGRQPIGNSSVVVPRASVRRPTG